MGRGIIERDIETRVPGNCYEDNLYCGGGFRSALVADNLQKMGYTNVESMDGGWRGLGRGRLADGEGLKSCNASRGIFTGEYLNRRDWVEHRNNFWMARYPRLDHW